MNTFRKASSRLGTWLLPLAFAASTVAHAGLTDIATTPLVTSAPSSVLPNLLFVLDDSGSMGWDFLPDWVDDTKCRSAGATNTSSGSFTLSCSNNGGQPLYKSSSYNGVYYNPAITYLPPLKWDGTPEASQTSAATGGWTNVKNDFYGIQSTSSTDLTSKVPDVEWCTDSNYTDCLRNGNYVLPGTVNSKNYTTAHSVYATGSGKKAIGAPDAATTVDQSWGPHYYTINAGEFCTSDNLRNCTTVANATYTVPAPVRWCDTAANAAASSPPAGACQALKIDGKYDYPRFPTRFFTSGTVAVPASPEVQATSVFTISVSGCSKKVLGVSSLKVNGVELMTAATGLLSAPSSTNLATAIVGKISSTNYTASNSNATITMTARSGLNANGYSVVLTTQTGSTCTFSPTSASFSGYVAAQPAQAATPAGWYGSFSRVDIVPTTTTYPKAATRSDCAGATCSYAEEMTNFANWWTFYRTRMQMMKSSASLAFAPLSNQFRVGYMSINNNTGSDFANVKKFETSDKQAWFDKLRKAKPNNSTPLRSALSTAGKYFANTLTKINNVNTSDPIQYSCQRNFTLLSTDGYWNESVNPTKLDNTTAIGDQDGTLPRPYLDGNATQNTLADVAAYYYNTDLRNGTNCTGALGTDVCENNVATAGEDNAQFQHMTTFTLGLGASGYMLFRPDYKAATLGDYFSIKNGVAADPASGVCTWQASGVCNWPVPLNNTQTAIDDLWHAAVNGRGAYFSARDPATLYSGLGATLAAIAAKTGAAAAATTSNPNVSTGDNFLFSSAFRSSDWDGQLYRRQLDVTTGDISANVDWEARSQLDAKPSRTIYMRDATNLTTGMKPFAWASMTSSEQAYFQTPAMNSRGALSQFCNFGITCLTAVTQAAAAGEPLVRFIAGDRSNEGPSTDISTYFRQRSSLLGDIVNSEAIYVKTPMYNYGDPGYGSYKAGMSTRQGVVYVGANDGMLHAFNADSGAELWAYVPSMVLPNLYKLADKDYANRHQTYVDSSPVVGDIFGTNANAWRTILVGGLGAGGRGYYALDITNPAEPKVLWEFTDDNLGLTFGKAEINKLANGTWAVFLPSGYNNVSPGDGRGRLYVLNAETGAVIRTIDTGVGDTTTPAGFAQIRAWVEYGDIDNTAARVYGGDNLGNVWRFDVNNTIDPAGYEATLLATLRNANGTAQPVTSRPELGKPNGYPMVYVGTGRYLGASDFSDATPQSVYAIKDKLLATGYGNPRANTNRFVQQTLTNTTCPGGISFCTTGRASRTVTSNPVDLSVNDGWYVDLPASRERANTDPMLAFGMLVVTTNVLDPTPCVVGGYSFVNFFDFRTGGAVATSNGYVSLRADYTSSRPVIGCTMANACSVYLQPGSNTGSASPSSGGGGGGSGAAGTPNTVNGCLPGDLTCVPPTKEDTPPPQSNGATRRTSWQELTTR